MKLRKAKEKSEKEEKKHEDELSRIRTLHPLSSLSFQAPIFNYPFSKMFIYSY